MNVYANLHFESKIVSGNLKKNMYVVFLYGLQNKDMRYELWFDGYVIFWVNASLA